MIASGQRSSREVRLGVRGVSEVLQFSLKCFRGVRTAMFDPYHPELHYMRGPGPKWRKKHASTASHDKVSPRYVRCETVEAGDGSPTCRLQNDSLSRFRGWNALRHHRVFEWER